MDDVQRVFRHLVQVLAAHAPDRLYLPIPITEVHDTILPYRRYRRELRFEAIEDYEMAMLRLYAGEGGYVAVEPDEVRAFLVREARAINPSSGAFRSIGRATVTLDPSRVRAVLDPRVEYAPAEAPPTEAPVEVAFPEPGGKGEPEPGSGEPPRHPEPAPPPETAADSILPTPAQEATGRSPPLPLPTCPNCDTALPMWRSVTYCPFCGSPQWQRVECQRCGERVEEGWRFCVACGESVENEPHR